MKEIELLELFGGIGACSKALDRLGIPYHIADYVEIDKYAVASYNAMHNTNFEPQDITTWDKDIKVDLIMHGSPCQDFSIAGLQAGGDEGSGTRSSLMYETIRIVEKLKPKYVIWENVKNLLSKKHKHNFDAYIETMNKLGYTSYYQVLNAKEYGYPEPLPQNRERVFTISIKNEEYLDFDGSYIKPITDFKFPVKQELKLRLKDMLEDEVDEKYYLSDNMMNYVLDMNDKQLGTKWEGRADNDTLNSNIAHTLSVRGAGGCQRAGVSNFVLDGTDEEMTVKEAKLRIKNNNKQLNETIEKNIDKFEEGKILNTDLYNRKINENISQTLTEPNHNSQRLFDGLRIRKLTPKECWRLMGFNDEDIEKAAKVNSNTQLYKQAGNSIVVNVLEAILTNLLK